MLKDRSQYPNHNHLLHEEKKGELEWGEEKKSEQINPKGRNLKTLKKQELKEEKQVWCVLDSFINNLLI